MEMKSNKSKNSFHHFASKIKLRIEQLSNVHHCINTEAVEVVLTQKSVILMEWKEKDEFTL